MFGLCNATVSEAMTCQTFPEWLGAVICYIVIWCFIAWLVVLIIRTIWLAHKKHYDKWDIKDLARNEARKELVTALRDAPAYLKNHDRDVDC